MPKPTPTLTESGESSVTEVTLLSVFDSEESGLLKFAFSIVGRRSVAEDIVQESFLQLHANWDQVESPRAWLYRTARNRAFNVLRDTKREVLHREGDSPDCASNEPCAEHLELQVEAVAALRNSLQELDEADRQLVQLKYFENLKYREISERSGLKVGNVGYRLHHILKELAGKLRRLGFDDES